MIATRFVARVLICVATVSVGSNAWAAQEQAIPPLLAENWPAAATALVADRSLPVDPVTRLLIGYVSLASNRTSDAMAMFVSVRDRSGLQRWQDWTGQLAKSNPDNRMAELLSIDAAARLGDVTAGTRAMQSLLERQPRFALAYELAGALAILRDDTASARAAFTTATTVDPQLADAWISRGSLEAIARTPLDMPGLGNVPSAQVLGYFDHALALDPNSAPALLGRGAILYGLGRFAESEEAFANAQRVTPWLSLASYDDTQTELTVLRRYAVQLASQSETNPGSTFQMQFNQESQLLDGRAHESSVRFEDAVTHAENAEAPFDPKFLDTADEAQVGALVAKYGLSTIELANAARIDANSAALFQRNTEMQKSVGTLSALRNAWEAIATLDVASDLAAPEKDIGVGLIHLTGAAAAALPKDNQWAAQIGIDHTESAALAVAKGEDIGKAFWSPGLGDVATGLNVLFQGRADDIAEQHQEAMVVAKAAQNNLHIAQWLSSQNVAINRPNIGSPNAVLAPDNYALDAGSQAALVRTVSQSVRGGSVVIVPEDHTQSFLLQQELNRQGIATQTASTPTEGIDLARHVGSTWVIGTDGHWANAPLAQQSSVMLKPPDILPSWGGGGQRPQPLSGVSADHPAPPPPGGPSFDRTNWRGFQRFTSPAEGGPGGVLTFKDAYVDDGQWPVQAPLTLGLPVVLIAGAASSEKH